eukprot:TRINITY_DN1404_c0_g1_i1.p1 TRINITY_DN1404_c0_g1~~TRINITY_DN1404_c0_g1_i1.p1  ORF type:complete len:116 (-),score=30.50 TRINITY_DN1404_c0_g1_i1:1410-1757(-)
MLRPMLLLPLLAAIAYAGLVKRDTVDDIEDSINGLINGNDNPLDDLKEGGACLLDSNCLEPLQFCNRENPLNPHCQYVVWVWVGLGVAAALLLLTIFGSCLCCSCCCMHGLCRKK